MTMNVKELQEEERILFKNSIFYILYSMETTEHGFGTTWGWVNNDMTSLIFRWSIPWSQIRRYFLG